MSKWVSVAKKSDIPEGQTKVFTVNDQEIAISRLKGQFYAFENSCSHMELPLDEGEIEGTIIECPHHGARFDLKTGEAVRMPAATPIHMYKVHVDGEMIQVEISE